MTILFFKRTESDDTKFHIDIAEKKLQNHNLQRLIRKR